MTIHGKCRYCGLPVAISEAALDLLRSLVRHDVTADIGAVTDDLVCNGGPCFDRWQREAWAVTRAKTDAVRAVCDKIRAGESGRIASWMMHDSEYSKWIATERDARRRRTAEGKGRKTKRGDAPKGRSDGTQGENPDQDQA
jgi:hypothetical protein